MKIWNMTCEEGCMYAVVYANTLDEAIAKIREQRKEFDNGENWTGEEWTDDMYGGVLLFS